MKRFLFLFFAALTLIPAGVLADGMVIDPYVDYVKPLPENSQIAAINYQNGYQKMIISTNFDMQNVDKAVWIFPIAASPKKIVIDVTREFPNFYGYDVVAKAKNDIDTVVDATTLTQIYPIIKYLFFANIMYAGETKALAETAAGALGGTIEGVTVWDYVEKEGIATEVITTKTADALYSHLSSKGLNLREGSFDVLDDYIGDDYSFVVSWILQTQKSDRVYCKPEQRNPGICYTLYDPVCGSNGAEYSNDCVACMNSNVEWYTKGSCYQKTEYARMPYYQRQPGIFVTFPTDKIYYPLIPTSIYGSKKIPLRLYVLDYVEPELYDEIKSYVKTSYYLQGSINTNNLEDFFGNMDTSNVKYTKIEMSVPSKYFVKDLWINKGAPVKVGYATAVYSFMQNGLVAWLLLVIFISAVTGFVTGLIIFRDPIKFTLVGLANVFTIIGVAIAIVFVKTKRVDERLRRQVKQAGMMIIASDSRKFAFVILYSIMFLIMALLIGFLLKLPLM
jgi:hypothetical protein